MFAVPVLAQSSGSYKITWYTIDGDNIGLRVQEMGPQWRIGFEYKLHISQRKCTSEGIIRRW